MNQFRITEAFKWAYAVRTELGDPSDPDITQFVNEVTSHTTNLHCKKRLSYMGYCKPTSHMEQCKPTSHMG